MQDPHVGGGGIGHECSVFCFCRRLDYFVLSERLTQNVTDCVIRKDVYGSDHCPLVLGLAPPAPPAPPQDKEETTDNQNQET